MAADLIGSISVESGYRHLLRGYGRDYDCILKLRGNSGGHLEQETPIYFQDLSSHIPSISPLLASTAKDPIFLITAVLKR